ncbi:MAG: cadherin-like beta sandwich domain-containing protein [Planctomycetota bacterium]
MNFRRAAQPPLFAPLLTLLFLFFAACSSGGGGGDGGGPGAISQLTILEFSGVTLSPAFSPTRLFYDGEVNSTVSQVTLTANTSLTSAVIDVNGTELGAGSVAQVLPLLEGDNVFEVTATAADGSSFTRYLVTITRAAAPVLDGLSVSVGSLSPTFAANTTSYAVAAPFLQREVVVTASTSAAGGLIEIDGVAVASGQPSAPLALDQGANDIVVRVATPDGSLRDYTVTVNRATADEFVERVGTVGSLSGGGDELGYSVAIDGDTLVVGSWRADGGQIDTGVAYVLRRNGQVWQEEAFLSAATQVAGAGFGASVAIEGDTLVVGQIGTNQAVVFTRSGAIWTQRAVLFGNGLAPYRYGNAVAISGDTIAVASRDDDGELGPDYLESAGAVYVYTGSGANWTQVARLTASNPGQEDQFGYSLALDGDTMVVGARFEDSTSTGIGSTPNDAGSDVGAAYVFTGAGATWTLQAYVKPAVTTDVRWFGTSIDIDGDRMVVGAPLCNTLGIDAGLAYVFDRIGGVWSESAVLAGNNTGSNDLFGWSVSVDGDTIAVGARQESSNTTGTNPQQNDDGDRSGAVYQYELTGQAWQQQVFLKASDAQDLAWFGFAVALSGDTLVVGAPYHDGPGTDIGRFYVFR